ncbi:hypothetical protein ALC53_11369 [Atta colombica]|uniref:Uncharacterized protein n=1 Tax=Atta colombica TaxID=520822 RepID=A0A195B1U0_9HYME|nr:hypothetical protein ALC53_11369 [Atta colombica]
MKKVVIALIISVDHGPANKRDERKSSMSGLYIVTPRAPTQSNKNLVSSTSAPAHPIPAVNTLACPLPGILFSTNKIPTNPEGLSLSLLVSSTSPPRLLHVRFSDCLRTGTTKPAGPKDVNRKRRICLIDDGSGVDFISLVRTRGRKENEEAKGKTPSREENGAA